MSPADFGEATVSPAIALPLPSSANAAATVAHRAMEPTSWPERKPLNPFIPLIIASF